MNILAGKLKCLKLIFATTKNTVLWINGYITKTKLVVKLPLYDESKLK